MKEPTKLLALGTVLALALSLPVGLFANLAVVQLDGLRVENRQGVFLGIVEDSIVDPITDRVEFLMVATQPGERRIRVVPPRFLELSPDLETLVLDIGGERWASAPTIDPHDVEPLDDERTSREIHRFYGDNLRAGILETPLPGLKLRSPSPRDSFHVHRLAPRRPDVYRPTPQRPHVESPLLRERRHADRSAQRERRGLYRYSKAPGPHIVVLPAPKHPPEPTPVLERDRRHVNY